MKPQAIALLSGGLDSSLAAKLIIAQGIAVEGVNFYHSFYPRLACEKRDSGLNKLANFLGIKIKVVDVCGEFLELVKHPCHGYGSNLNPCIDCHIFMLEKAALYMKEKEAQFLITGEVVGQRPMSQKTPTLKIIEKKSGLEGRILRPLSAELLEPTQAEKQGLVNREKLLGISGRGRKTQIQLAKEYGLSDYPNPAGGCLLTDPGFTKRLKDLMHYQPDFTLLDIDFLKIGRHFRFSPKAKLVVGRNKSENQELAKISRPNEWCFSPQHVKGPLAVGQGDFNLEMLKVASAIVAYYCDQPHPPQIELEIRFGQKREFIEASPLAKETLSNLMI